MVTKISRKIQEIRYAFAYNLLEPEEKLLFNFLVLLCSSLLFLSVYVYLPSHLKFVGKRISFYVLGTEHPVSKLHY